MGNLRWAVSYARMLLDDGQENIPPTVVFDGEEFGLMKGYDYDAEQEFITVGYTLPEGWFAEIEDGTFGTLQGIRVYPTEG